MMTRNLPALATAALSIVATWSESLREDFEERAAIMEFDGGMSRVEAEVAAWELLRGRVEKVR
jgi:hypothetical protein